MSQRYVCIHGHFYQPPRENPWLEAIELQDSAHPHHDWNERITEECYAPNSTARILGSAGRITRIVNNYESISFNFGPTLLSWMESARPEVHQAILDGDRASQERFSGHGSALAQVYHHSILPLSNRRDKVTEVRWGIRDFEHRFGRRPEGMWLAETAADEETLEVLAEEGIGFTILAQHQAARFRSPGESEWTPAEGGIDPTRPYRATLSSGRTIDLFFYDGPISRAVAFENLLDDGEVFAHRLLSGFSDGRDWPQLLHIATDGESYGHHHRRGEMALAYALERLSEKVTLINYGEYLERHPPETEVEIIDKTSWSCIHGVERWRSDCGCSTRDDWTQAWRKPLRDALDWLRDAIAPRFEDEARALLVDPWRARDEYIEVVLDRSPESTERFLAAHCRGPLSPEERSHAWKLLELQRHALMMYTSCGWFFADLGGIETVQVLQYAGRVIQLAQSLFDVSFEEPFLQRLEQGKSNVVEVGDGRRIYERFVEPAVVDLPKVAAHYAASSLFEEEAPEKIFCYSLSEEDRQPLETGRTRLAVGRVIVRSDITEEEEHFSYAAIHLGDHNLSAGVRDFQGDEPYGEVVSDVSEAFRSADLSVVFECLNRHFLDMTYSLRSLFRDEQRKIVDWILESTLSEAEDAYRRLYEYHAPLMHFINGLEIPLPRALREAAEFVLNIDLLRSFQEDELDPELAGRVLHETRSWGLNLETESLSYALEHSTERLAERLEAEPENLELLLRLEGVTRFGKSLPFFVDLWETQNVCYRMLQTRYSEFLARREHGDARAEEWIAHFERLAENLSILIERDKG